MTATDRRHARRGSGRSLHLISLSGKRIATLAADRVEQVELERPRAALENRATFSSALISLSNK